MSALVRFLGTNTKGVLCINWLERYDNLPRGGNQTCRDEEGDMGMMIPIPVAYLSSMYGIKQINKN